METFHAIFFDSSLMIMTTIQILFMKYKQRIVVEYLKKTFQLLIRSSISLMAVLNNVTAKTLLICVIISKISVWMLNGYSLQLVVIASHQVMVLGDLLIVMLRNTVYKDPYITIFGATYQSLIYV